MKKRYVVIGILTIIIIGLSFYFDNMIVQTISSMRSNILNELFLKIALISSEIILFIFLMGLFVLGEKRRKWIFPLITAMGISTGISFLFKILIHRMRPFQLGLVSILPELEKASHLIWNFSFPSFHAMFAFCTVPFLSKEFPIFRYIWITFAGLIAFSRIYFGLHFLSDVIVGGLIGYLIGVVILKVEEKHKFVNKISKKFKKH